MEMEALGTSETSKLVGSPVNSVALPGNSKIAAIARPRKAHTFEPMLVNETLCIEQNDRVVVFVPKQEDERTLFKVQKLIERAFYAPPESF